jgi:hypothetical protein
MKPLVDLTVNGGSFIVKRIYRINSLCHNFARTICIYVFESVKPTGCDRR